MKEIPEFPITITFEDGERVSYQDVEDIELNLEDFDSELAPECTVEDSSGREVILIVRLLRLKTLELAQSGETLGK